jgi:hypothetical protein
MPAPRPVRCRFADTAAATPSSIGASAFPLVSSCVVRKARWRPATRIALPGSILVSFPRRKPAGGGIGAKVAAATRPRTPLCLGPSQFRQTAPRSASPQAQPCAAATTCWLASSTQDASSAPIEPGGCGVNQSDRASIPPRKLGLRCFGPQLSIGVPYSCLCLRSAIPAGVERQAHRAAHRSARVGHPRRRVLVPRRDQDPSIPKAGAVRVARLQARSLAVNTEHEHGLQPRTAKPESALGNEKEHEDRGGGMRPTAHCAMGGMHTVAVAGGAVLLPR